MFNVYANTDKDIERYAEVLINITHVPQVGVGR